MGGVGSLKISISENSKNGVNIDISDTGKGMSSATQRKIFNPDFLPKKRLGAGTYAFKTHCRGLS